VIDRSDLAPFLPYIVRGVVAIAIAVGFVVGGLTGSLENQSWPLLLLIPLLVCVWPFRVLLIDSTCENCQATLNPREKLTRSPLCEICVRFLAMPVPVLERPDEATDTRENSRREFRWRAAEALRRPRALNDRLAAALTESRLAAGLRIGSPRAEPARIFWTYAAQLRAVPDFSPDDVARLVQALEALTGRGEESLDDPRWFERAGTLMLIRAADADWLRALDDTDHVLVARGEDRIWVEEVSRLRPAELRVKEEVGAGLSIDVARGATVSAKATLERTTQLPPGEPAPIGKATIVVTDRRILLIGDQTLIVNHEEIVALSAPWARICRINYEGNAEPAYVKCRSGLLLCAVINCGIRLRGGRDHAAGSEVVP
jgi:hypothetical protein